MANFEMKPCQETTSVYFNNIIRDDVSPVSVDSLPQETVDNFNRQVMLAFGPDGEATVRRIHYLVPYILQSIDWDEYGIPLEAWQLQYYYRRDRFIDKTRLNYERFLDHEPLQRSISALGLDPEPTFEFILFLKYYFGMRSELRHSALEQLSMACDAIKDLPDGKTASMDIKIGSKHFVISNTGFVKDALLSIDREGLSSGAFVNDFSEGSARDKIRAIDYYMVKTLLDYLPTNVRKARTGMYTQDERNFGLSVLSLCGRLRDVERDIVCSRYNNITFDRLMREFRGVRIPFAMELFL